ncbi:hypothetical protein, partial [Paraclostridium dentum]|uniref:hypothetical protein n=1 Tax=Paraclostridium dentum TaxID=2662455 RepID=UPI003F3785F7
IDWPFIARVKDPQNTAEHDEIVSARLDQELVGGKYPFKVAENEKALTENKVKEKLSKMNAT